VTVDEVMEKYGLGPNGALIMAADLIVNEIEHLREEVEDLNPDILIADTPGQMELFAFRASGPFLVRALSDDPEAIIYLFDSVFSYNPLNYVSNMFLSAAVHIRFLLPQVHVLSKCDLLPKRDLDTLIEWSENPEALELAIDERLKGTSRLLGQNISQAIQLLDLNFPLIPVSSKTNEGLTELNAMLERIFKGGEKITY